jgi:hypothetical protein
MNDLSRALAKIVPQVTYSFRAFPGQGQSLAQLQTQMQRLGNPVLEVNEEGGYILCSRFTEKSDSWGCLLCINGGEIVLVDSEDELRAHLDVCHHGWEIDEEGVPVVVA